MEDLFDILYDFFKTAGILIFFVLLMILIGNYSLLKNMSSRIANEAEISGVISASYINTTYNNSPLSRLDGQFRILEITPGINSQAINLGDRIYIKIQKDVVIAKRFIIPITASSYAINQGFYGNGYKR